MEVQGLIDYEEDLYVAIGDYVGRLRLRSDYSVHR